MKKLFQALLAILQFVRNHSTSMLGAWYGMVKAHLEVHSTKEDIIFVEQISLVTVPFWKYGRGCACIWSSGDTEASQEANCMAFTPPHAWHKSYPLETRRSNKFLAYCKGRFLCNFKLSILWRLLRTELSFSRTHTFVTNRFVRPFIHSFIPPVGRVKDLVSQSSFSVQGQF